MPTPKFKKSYALSGGTHVTGRNKGSKKSNTSKNWAKRSSDVISYRVGEDKPDLPKPPVSQYRDRLS